MRNTIWFLALVGSIYLIYDVILELHNHSHMGQLIIGIILFCILTHTSLFKHPDDKKD